MEFTDLAPAMPLINAGKLKLIAVLASRRSVDLPDVPALAETVPGYEGRSWQGLFARAGTPKPIVGEVNAALVADLKKPETIARFNTIGIVAQSDTPDEFRAFITAETAKWEKVIKASGIERSELHHLNPSSSSPRGRNAGCDGRPAPARSRCEDDGETGRIA